MPAIGVSDKTLESNPMELYQLRTFLTIARTGNLTRAAAILAASQPAVSGQLKALEDELGLELFLRTSRGMELTEAGRILRPKAEEIDARASELLALARAMEGKVFGTCRIGLNTEAGVLRIPELVTALAASAPLLALELVQGSTHTILEDVSTGKLAAGFIFGSHGRADLSAKTLARIELVLAAPIAWKQRLTQGPCSQALAGPWVWPPRDCPFYEKTIALARSDGTVTPGGLTADDESTLLRLVVAGAGISLLPAFLVAEAAAKELVIPVPVPGTDIELSFVWRAHDEESPFVRPLIDALGCIWDSESL